MSSLKFSFTGDYTDTTRSELLRTVEDTPPVPSDPHSPCMPPSEGMKSPRRAHGVPAERLLRFTARRGAAKGQMDGQWSPPGHWEGGSPTGRGAERFARPLPVAVLRRRPCRAAGPKLSERSERKSERSDDSGMAEALPVGPQARKRGAKRRERAKRAGCCKVSERQPALAGCLSSLPFGTPFAARTAYRPLRPLYDVEIIKEPENY